jgi:parvulin-like peptidyl-prolyl isomerase
MKKNILFIIIILLAVVASAALLLYSLYPDYPPQEVQPEEKLVAMVNEEPITVGDFVERYRQFTRRANVPLTESPSSTLQLKRGFLNKLIETRLLLQEAEVRGLTVTDEELDREINLLKEDYPKDTLNEALEKIGMKLEEWKEEHKEKLLIDKLIQREIDSVIHVSDDEIQSFYESNRKEFQQPLQVRARQIVVATEEEASALRSRILNVEDFEEIARLHSLSPDAENGGDLGIFSKGQMPEEFDEIVFRYQEATVSKVVHSPYGFHIFKVEERFSPRTLKLEEVREQIASRIFQGRQEAFFKEWLDSLKRQAKITIYPENLEDI